MSLWETLWNILRENKFQNPVHATPLRPNSWRKLVQKSFVPIVPFFVRKPQVWELSRLCPETSTKLYVHEFGFRSARISFFQAWNFAFSTSIWFLKLTWYYAFSFFSAFYPHVKLLPAKRHHHYRNRQNLRGTTNVLSLTQIDHTVCSCTVPVHLIQWSCERTKRPWKLSIIFNLFDLYLVSQSL